MDRVIKFRGKDISGKWRFGDLIHYRSCVTISETKAGLCGNYEVMSESVGQFTGFKDIDGKEIFEGDLLQNQDHPQEIYNVKMVQGNWSALYINIKSDWDFDYLDWLLSIAPFKVIGNIYDNPELLEGGVNDD